MSLSPASPYAAPNTPIASAKRPKIHLKAKLTPKSAIQNLPETPESDHSDDSPPDKNVVRKLNLGRATNHKQLSQDKNRMGSVPVTPSKNLFSPGLRVQDGSVNHIPTIESDSEGEQEDECPTWNNADRVVDDDSGSPDDEVKRSVDDSMETEGSATQENLSPADPATEDNIYAAAIDTHQAEIEVQVDPAPADEEEEDDSVFNPYAFMAQLPDPNTLTRLTPPHLPSYAGNLPTLVLDLDETLVHCTVEPVAKPDVIFPVDFNGVEYKVYGRKRPYLDYFLESVSKSFEVVLFTASQRVYADTLLDILDPEKKFVKHRLFRESCLLVQGSYLKDLEVLGRDLKKTLLVDNSPYAYGYQIDNGVPIESWYDDEHDTELLKLLGFLKRAQTTDDVRPLVRGHFKTHELIRSAGLKLAKKLAAGKGGR